MERARDQFFRQRWAQGNLRAGSGKGHTRPLNPPQGGQDGPSRLVDRSPLVRRLSRAEEEFDRAERDYIHHGSPDIKVPMATLATRFTRIVDFYNPNQVKVVLRVDGRALYFSRSRLPFSRDLGLTIDDAWLAANPCYKHLGLYAYHAELLEKFAKLPLGRYEQTEKLEQLRVLENGYDIMVGVTNDPSIGVDTLEDAVKFERSLG